MLFDLPDPETLFAAVQARDPAYGGHAFVCVTTTGIFCRIPCPARVPNFANVRFLASAVACLEAGFRPACAVARSTGCGRASRSWTS